MSASGGESQSESRSAWIRELEDCLVVRHHALVTPLVTNKRGKRIREPYTITEAEAYAGVKQDADWMTVSNPNMSTILLKGYEVPAWIYGFISHTNTVCLPENGTADECKEGILAVMEQSAASVVRRVAEALEKYAITIITVEVDLLGEHIVIHCMTEKPVMQVNTIMGNKVMRQAVPGRAKICVNTHVEENRRTDDYLKNKPERQEISREFYYEDGSLVKAEPEHWSAGQVYEPGDIIKIGSVKLRIEEERNNPWQNVAFDGDPIAGRDDPRRLQAGTPFSPGERAYWNARRNR